MAEWIQTDDPRRLTTEEAGIATFMTAPVPGSEIGGDGGLRTPDRVIMIHLLCRLSYIALGKKWCFVAEKLVYYNTGKTLEQSIQGESSRQGF